MNLYRTTHPSSTGQPYERWHVKDGPYLRRLRTRLESLLGGACSYCGITRSQGANLHFHHHLGRDWSPRLLSWSQRLHRYHKEIKAGTLLYLACDATGNDCHNTHRRQEPTNMAEKLYDYDHGVETGEPAGALSASQPF